MDDLVLELAQAMCDDENERRSRTATREVSNGSFFAKAKAVVPVVEAQVAAERERIEAALTEFVLEYYGTSNFTTLDMIPIGAVSKIVRGDET